MGIRQGKWCRLVGAMELAFSWGGLTRGDETAGKKGGKWGGWAGASWALEGWERGEPEQGMGALLPLPLRASPC